MMRVAVLLCLLGPQFVWAASLDTILENNKGVKALQEEKNREAFTIFSEAIVNHPEEAVLSYNLGLTFLANEEWDKALQAFSTAATTAEDPALKFQSHFNAGVAAGAAKQIEVALSHYQEALEIDPNSQEVKTNIELLLQNQGGGGSGGGDSDKKEQKEDGDGQDENQQPQPQEQKPKEKPKPKPFKSEELSPQDAKKILDELRRQEEQIRAKFNNQRRKEQPVEKDW